MFGLGDSILMLESCSFQVFRAEVRTASKSQDGISACKFFLACSALTADNPTRNKIFWPAEVLKSKCIRTFLLLISVWPAGKGLPLASSPKPFHGCEHSTAKKMVLFLFQPVVVRWPVI